MRCVSSEESENTLFQSILNAKEEVNGPVKFCLQIHSSYLGGTYRERKPVCRSSLLRGDSGLR